MATNWGSKEYRDRYLNCEGEMITFTEEQVSTDWSTATLGNALGTTHSLTNEINKPKHKGRQLVAIELNWLKQFYKDNAEAAIDVAKTISEHAEKISTDNEHKVVYGISISDDIEPLKQKIANAYSHTTARVATTQITDKNMDYLISIHDGIEKKSKAIFELEDCFKL